mmetsp:Transcript_15364/g.39169  ORF Transcript_15364/g.39169 Transcript_15364/m.39169 type:complete len:357 (+) Transcript_15364:3360-4430(+)
MQLRTLLGNLLVFEATRVLQNHQLLFGEHMSTLATTSLCAAAAALLVGFLASLALSASVAGGSAILSLLSHDDLAMQQRTALQRLSVAMQKIGVQLGLTQNTRAALLLTSRIRDLIQCLAGHHMKALAKVATTHDAALSEHGREWHLGLFRELAHQRILVAGMILLEARIDQCRLQVHQRAVHHVVHRLGGHVSVHLGGGHLGEGRQRRVHRVGLGRHAAELGERCPARLVRLSGGGGETELGGGAERTGSEHGEKEAAIEEVGQVALLRSQREGQRCECRERTLEEAANEHGEQGLRLCIDLLPATEHALSARLQREMVHQHVVEQHGTRERQPLGALLGQREQCVVSHGGAQIR